jgi:hypothetical protein
MGTKPLSDQSRALGERGQFGIFGALALIAFILSVTLAVGTLFQWASESVAKSLNVKELLLYCPRLKGGIADLARFGPDLAEGTDIARLEATAGKIYSRIQAIALGLMVGVFFFVGFCFMLEKYILPEGTTDRLIRESVLVVILLFIAPMLYNLLASGINCLNVHGIMGTDENGAKQKVENIIEAATNIELTGVPVASELSKPVGVMFFGGFTFVTIFGVGVLCLLRFFMVLALALLLPLILVFRLYPPFFRFSSTLTEVLMGMTLSTILVAAVVVLAQPMLTTGGFNGWIFAIAILLLSSSLATVLAPQIGGVVSTAASHISHSIGSMIGGTIAGLGTLPVAGGVAGLGALGRFGVARGVGAVGPSAGPAFRGMLSAMGGAAFGAPDLGKALVEGYRGSQKAVEEAMRKMDTSLRGPGNVIQLQGVLDSIRPEEMLEPDRQEIQGLFVGGLGDPKVEKGLRQLQMVAEGIVPEDQWARGIAKRGAWRVLGLDPGKRSTKTVINRLAENKEFAKEATRAGRAEVMRTLSRAAVKRLKSYRLPQDRAKLWDDIRKGYERLLKNGFKLSKKPTVNERLAAAFIKTHLALGDWEYPPPRS